MDPPVTLYNVGLSQQELDKLMEEIRSTSYIDEVESGECAREESPLYNEIEVAKETPKEQSVEALLQHAGRPKVLAIADGKHPGSVLIVETKPDGQVAQLYVAARDAIEVCCNCRVSNMDLAEFKSMAESTGEPVYDSKRS